MKYCGKCGNRMNEDMNFCPKCGAACNIEHNGMYQAGENMYGADGEASIGMKILCFLIPIVGLILYLANNRVKPYYARCVGKWSLIGFVINLILISIW